MAPFSKMGDWRAGFIETDARQLEEERQMRMCRRFAVPTRLSEVGERFPFLSWASANLFRHNADAAPLFRLCESAAEAFFIRPFTDRAGFRMDGTLGVVGALKIELQVKAVGFRIDVVLREPGHFPLAIEIDGMRWHHQEKEQVAADYLRQRRIVAKGFTVIRFTAPEVFADAGACWKQVDIILENRRRV